MPTKSEQKTKNSISRPASLEDEAVKASTHDNKTKKVTFTIISLFSNGLNGKFSIFLMII